jgi:hypothetical protein
LWRKTLYRKFSPDSWWHQVKELKWKLPR